MISLAVVTPWYEHRELWPDYERALEDAWPEELIILDNGSEPPLDFASVRFEENRGFSSACNVGLQQARSDAVCFLNSDIALERPGWLDQIRDSLEPGVLVGAQLRFDPHAWVGGQVMPYLDGWCLAGMREDLLELGGFDEELAEPAYYSDNLLCLAAREAGMTLREADVGLRHKLNGTARDNPHVEEATKANHAVYLARVRELIGVA